MISLKKNKYKVYTPSGYKDFSGLRKVVKNQYIHFVFSDDSELKCSLEHKFLTEKKEIESKDLNVGDYVDVVGNIKLYIKYKKIHDSSIELYDIINVDGGNLFVIDNGIISHNCEFSTTGNTVIELLTIQHYRDNIAKEPIEMRGNDKAYWIWEYPDYAKQYIVSADVSRGDAEDYSAFHVIDADTMTQVAEYQGKINPKDYGNVLVGVATEYNNAILIVENATYGHTTLQQIIDRKYPNTFYSSADLQFVDLERQFTNKINAEERKLTPGFTTTSKTRPIMISNMEVYFREKSIIVRSIRLLNELSTFIWDGNKACAMANHHDDLVMSFAMGLWVRNTALKMRNSGMDITKSLLDGIHRSVPPIYKSSNTVAQNSWNMNVGTTYNDKKENLTWLL